jgi:hypothetical protein
VYAPDWFTGVGQKTGHALRHASICSHCDKQGPQNPQPNCPSDQEHNEYGVLTYHGTVDQAETTLAYRTTRARPEDDIMDEPKLVPCPECGGTGKVPLHLDNLPGPSPPLQIDCPTCGGTGLVRNPIPDPPT